MKQYNPYAIDWRFLPRDALYIKDCVRNKAVAASNYLARSPVTRSAWINLVGQGILRSIRRAGKLFVHIPKTGGTSTAKILYNRNLPHYTYTFWTDVYQDQILGLETFSIIRSPFAKLMSSYKMILAGGTDIMAYSYYWRRKFPNLQSFDHFADYIYEHRLNFRELPVDLWEQAAFVTDAEGRVMVDRLFMLNERCGFSPELKDWLGVRDMPHLNATTPLAPRVSEETRRKVAEIYRRDVQLYDLLRARGGYAQIRENPLHVR